jgi:diacylglycerol kinase (ATP)
MGKPGNTGIRRIIRATKYSAQGFGHAWQHEAAFRQEIGLTLVLLPCAIWLGRTGFERFILIICCVFVLVVELLNSAIEAAVDRHGKEHHELSGRAKDLGSAAVFLSLVIVAATWGTVAYLRFFSET